MKKPLTPKRAEMVRHILAAKQIAAEGDEQVLEYILEMALGEVMGDQKAGETIRRLAESKESLQ